MSLSVSFWNNPSVPLLPKVAFVVPGPTGWFADIFCLSFPLSLPASTAIELTCLIESISTNNPRIEWKKIKNGIPSYVYFQNRISGRRHLFETFLFTKR